MHYQGSDSLMKGHSPQDPRGAPYLFGKKLKLLTTFFNTVEGTHKILTEDLTWWNSQYCDEGNGLEVFLKKQWTTEMEGGRLPKERYDQQVTPFRRRRKSPKIVKHSKGNEKKKAFAHRSVISKTRRPS
jgi:hypothetical protein